MTIPLGHRQNPHVLKSWPEPFRAMWFGRKQAEFRRNDRGFEQGQYVRFVEWEPKSGEFSGLAILSLITHIEEGPAFGVPLGFVVMTLHPVHFQDNEGIAPPEETK